MDPTPTTPTPPGRIADGLVRLWGPALVALALAAAVWYGGVHGTDLAAQTYHADVVRLHGLIIWDNGWYSGSLPLSYSVLSPVLSAVFGIGAVMIVASVLATWCFDRIVITMFGRRPLGSWYFAVSTMLAVSIGQVPYLTGEALALGAVLALLRGRRAVAVVLGVVSALLSPLAAAFLVMVCLVWAVHDQARRRRALVMAVATAVVVGAVSLLFPGNGAFPFAWSGLVVIELLCLTVLSPLVRTSSAVRLAAAIYGLASLASFVVPNPLGGNAARLAESFGIPLVACLVTAPANWRPSLPSWLQRGAGVLIGRRRAIGLVALAPFVVWQWAPGTGVVASASQPPSDTAAFYAPLVAQLHARHAGEATRVESVPTRDHWEAAYVAPYVGLARGWDRQIDVRDNALFYPPASLTGRTYRAWLLDNGITYVALPAAPLDYAAKAESTMLLADRVPGLRLVWSSATWRLWSVTGSPGTVSGPASLSLVAPDRLDVVMHRAGTALVRVHWTTYWKLADGSACVAPSADPTPWTVVHASRPGVVSLQASLLGGTSATCPTSG